MKKKQKMKKVIEEIVKQNENDKADKTEENNKETEMKNDNKIT